MKTAAFLLLITAVVTYAQMPSSKPKSDAQKIASAMGAGPKFVTQNATVLDWPSSPGGDFGFSGLEPTGGPVFRVFLKPPPAGCLDRR